jgi:hypothetical protein
LIVIVLICDLLFVSGSFFVVGGFAAKLTSIAKKKQLVEIEVDNIGATVAECLPRAETAPYQTEA